jgi:hypothetical protein
VAQHDSGKHVVEEPALPPMQRYRGDRLARRETVLKREIESYYVSDVDNTASILLDKQAMSIACTLELPDAVCDGLTFKQRLVQTARGDCLLIARWKPDRHMRRSTPEWSQKWFVEKQVYPPDNDRLFSRLERRIQEEGAAPEPVPAPISSAGDDAEAGGAATLLVAAPEPDVEAAPEADAE